ncbi:hypothetical protein [Cryobacterium sp. SO1]|uniref:hypothetical protein n=1 Tax=Cryobacterium sp. SO1 TaxID=1897061 RepID=UPI0010238364|nr:hypothetical protein [Cryobacterium sp. SO1]RZI36977.1 hypothetical protein BJQ95_00644 [Cryobacterium sp. SO1]
MMASEVIAGLERLVAEFGDVDMENRSELRFDPTWTTCTLLLEGTWVIVPGAGSRWSAAAVAVTA